MRTLLGKKMEQGKKIKGLKEILRAARWKMMHLSIEDRIRKLNQEMGKIDENLFEIAGQYENFFNEYVVLLKINRMIKASYSSLKRIADITGAKDILIEKTEGDNLLEIKLLIPK